LTVSNGDSIEIAVHVIANAFLCCGGTSASSSLTVDPLFLKLPEGAAFDSGITGFLNGSGPTPTPEPSSLLLLLSGLAALVWVARSGRGRSIDPEFQIRF
jgi:hypothetical protein